MMKAYRIRLLLLLAYTFTCSFAFAQEQEDKSSEDEESFAQPVQELPFSETVYLQEQHEVQTTLSYDHSFRPTQISNLVNYEMEYGFTDWWQVSLELQQSHRRLGEQRSFDLTHLEVGSMVGIVNKPEQALSFSFAVEFPVRKPDETEGEEIDGTDVSYFPMLIYARQIGNVQVHLNGGSELEGGDKEWFYNAAAVYGSGHWHPVLELNGTYEEEADWYVAPGMILNSDSGWEFIAGARRSLSSRNWGVALKVLYEFTVGKH